MRTPDAEPPPAQPTLTDGVVTLRPWRRSDVPAGLAGHDEEIAHWFGVPSPSPTPEVMAAAIDRWREQYAAGGAARFAIEHEGALVGTCEVMPHDHTGELSWTLFAGHRGRGLATRAVRVLADYAMTEVGQGGLGVSRVEARVEPEDSASLRVATRAGLRREGVRRVVPGTGHRAEATEYVVLARLSTDPPLSDPESFRALLNSFLPRKRAIGQLLLRDDADRVLLCRLTYKRDWDLPGGVVELGESPRSGAAREVEEELGFTPPVGGLLVTDWLPAWGGWDDAVCLVFDGGVHPADLVDRLVLEEREIRAAEFCTPAQVAERTADFTARRIAAALTSARRTAAPDAEPGVTWGGSYTESGR